MAKPSTTAAKPVASKYSTLAIAAFIFSLLFFIPLFSIIGIIAGISALVKISKNKKLKGKGLAIAAIIIGVVVTILQISFIVFVYNFIGFIGDIMNVGEKTPVESINYCIEEKSGPEKDMCIFMALSIHANQTENLDKNLCDENVESLEIRNYCNVILKKDKSYCDKILNTESRIECYELIEEIKK